MTTKLEQWRKRRGMTQDNLAHAVGISRGTYQRLENGDDDNPRFRYLVNCARVLDCELSDLVEDRWLLWKSFDKRRPEPTDPASLWREPD